MKDKAGRELKAGDYVIYGHAIGRSAALQYGVLLVVREDNATVQGARLHWYDKEPHLLRKGNLRYGDRTLKLHHDQIPPAVFKMLEAVEIPKA